MKGIDKADIEFLDRFLQNEELTEEGLKELDKRLQNEAFKKYYQQRLNEKYATTPTRLLIGYLPMIILIALTLIGIYLILIK